MTEKSTNLKTLLKNKISDKKMGRSGKKQKELILGQTFEKFGIDIDKFKDDLKAVQKQGGLEINLKK